jgi:hypothetical protein
VSAIAVVLLLPSLPLFSAAARIVGCGLSVAFVKSSLEIQDREI